MPVPAVGNVATPSNFLVLSAQAQVLLSWSTAPLATLYYVNRSEDNVTYTNIGNTVSLSYSDSTAEVGTIYSYTVQASTTLFSSPASQALTGQALNPGQTTVGNLRLECQQRTDRVNFDNISNQEWNSMISQSYKELWDILAQKFGDDYYVASPYTYTTTQNQQFYALPTDFKALLGAEIAMNPTDPNSWVTIKQFEFVQRNLWNYPNQYTMYGVTNMRYRLNGSNLYVVPVPQGGQTIRIWYVPRPNQLIADTDTVDAIAGWEEYIVADVCIKALTKTEELETAAMFLVQKKDLLKRVEEAAENRNIGEPQKVSDARRVNYAWWGDGFGASDGGMG